MLRWIGQKRRSLVVFLASHLLSHSKLWALIGLLLVARYFSADYGNYELQEKSFLEAALEARRPIADGSYHAHVCRPWLADSNKQFLLPLYEKHMLHWSGTAEVISANEMGLEYCFLVVGDQFLLNPEISYKSKTAPYTVAYHNLCKETLKHTLSLATEITLAWTTPTQKKSAKTFHNNTALKIQSQMLLLSGYDPCSIKPLK